MAISSYNPSASLNTSLAGINVGEGMERGSVSDAIRQIMADLAGYHADRAIIRASDFGAIGDGSTNDTAALTALWNSAIANPGVPHVLDALTYLVTAPLPAITVSNVHIEGQGAHVHDVGTPMTGTVIKYGGAVSAGKLLQTSSVSGASNQRIHGVKIKGIGLDCNSLIAYGYEALSIRDSDIELVVQNPTSRGVNLNVVASLGEDRNIQRTQFRFYLRQTGTPAATGMVLGGDALANVSMNEFWVDAVIADAPAIICGNTDNNEWSFVRVYKVPGGTATDGVSLYGGASEPVSSRGERFLFYSANVPIQAFGTASYTYPSTNHTAFLDVENNTPVPVIGAGASVNYTKSTTATAEAAWIAYTPTITATSGTITTVAGQAGFYRKIGKQVQFKAAFNITTNGTGATALRVTLPLTSGGTVGQVVTGKERAVTGMLNSGYIDIGATTVDLQKYDGGYPGVSGGVYVLSGTYEVA